MTDEAKREAGEILRKAFAAADVFAGGTPLYASISIHVEDEDVLRACAWRADVDVLERPFDSTEGPRLLLKVDLPEQRVAILASKPAPAESAPVRAEVES